MRKRHGSKIRTEDCFGSHRQPLCAAKPLAQLPADSALAAPLAALQSRKTVLPLDNIGRCLPVFVSNGELLKVVIRIGKDGTQREKEKEKYYYSSSSKLFIVAPRSVPDASKKRDCLSQHIITCSETKPAGFDHPLV